MRRRGSESLKSGEQEDSTGTDSGDTTFYLFASLLDSALQGLMSIPDLILRLERTCRDASEAIRYAMFLFTTRHEELVGVYASQLAHHRCIDLFVYMMELRLNSSGHVRYKIFLSAIEYLPFSPQDDSKGSFEEIIDRVLSRSREIRAGKYDEASDIAEQHRLQSLQKAKVMQWLCFTPPSTINDAKAVAAKLQIRALMHSNVLFREFSLISMWRVPAMPIGAHTLLSSLAEPLKQPMGNFLSTEDPDVCENLREFKDWREYYSCDATYRNWLKIELENAEVSPDELSPEEKQRAVKAARETLNSSLLLLHRKENPWLLPTQDHIYESKEPVFLELHATTMLSLPSGECMPPDATLCTTLTSSLFSVVSEEEILHRQLMVNISISPSDNHYIEVVLRCLAVEGDGLGPHEVHDGGILAAIIAAGFKGVREYTCCFNQKLYVRFIIVNLFSAIFPESHKYSMLGELVRFQAGVTMEISCLDAWYSSSEGSLEGPAIYIVRGLCRKCCLPETVLRCMQVSVSLMESDNPPESHHEFIELITSPESDFLHLFCQHQLQVRNFWFSFCLSMKSGNKSSTFLRRISLFCVLTFLAFLTSKLTSSSIKGD